MDFQIFGFINGMASENAILDLLGVFFARYFIWLLFFIVIIFGILPPSKKGETLSKANSAKAIIAALFAGAIALIIGRFINRARPFIIQDVNLLINPPFVFASFPSLHATLAFALGCTLFLFNKKIGLWFLAFSLLIGLSRIYVGVHYPSDILFGALIGFLSVFAIKKLTPVLERNRD